MELMLCLTKPLKHYGSSGLCSPQGAEKDYRNDIDQMTRGYI